MDNFSHDSPVGASSDVESLSDREDGQVRQRETDRLEDRQTHSVNQCKSMNRERQVIYLLTWLVFQHLQMKNCSIKHHQSDTDDQIYSQPSVNVIISQNRNHSEEI